MYHLELQKTGLHSNSFASQSLPKHYDIILNAYKLVGVQRSLKMISAKGMKNVKSNVTKGAEAY